MLVNIPINILDPMGMLSKIDNLTFPSRESVRLGGEGNYLLLRRHLSPWLMTMYAHIVHKWVRKIQVEDFKSRFSTLQGLFYRLNDVTNG